jgi:hypothetical protein
VYFLYFFRVYTWMYLHPGDTLEIAATTHWPCFEQLEELSKLWTCCPSLGTVPKGGRSKLRPIEKIWSTSILGFKILRRPHLWILIHCIQIKCTYSVYILYTVYNHRYRDRHVKKCYLAIPGTWLVYVVWLIDALTGLHRKGIYLPELQTGEKWKSLHPAGPHLRAVLCWKHGKSKPTVGNILFISLSLYISGLSIYLSNYLCLSIYLSNLNYLSIYFCLSLPLCLCLLSLSSYLSETAWGNQASW